jgi:putative mycofactocin binding protein MftB
MNERSDTTNLKSKIRNPKSASSDRSVIDSNTMADGLSRLKYSLLPGVQVREEPFGLLFYNYRGPRLYFVPSKDFIDAGFFDGRRSVDGLIEAVSARQGRNQREVAKRVTMILTRLEEKGLIYGQSIC